MTNGTIMHGETLFLFLLLFLLPPPPVIPAATETLPAASETLSVASPALLAASEAPFEALRLYLSANSHRPLCDRSPITTRL